MKVDVKGLATVIAEANSLSDKPSMSKQEQRRHATLLAMASVLRQGGVTLADLEAEHDNERRERAGLRPIQPNGNFTREQISLGEEFRSFAKGEIEVRDVEGDPKARLGTYSGLGFFAPTGMFARVFEAMKNFDPIFSNEAFTQIRTTNGRVETVPTEDDTTNDASVAGTDPQSTTEVDIAEPNQATLGCYSFASRRWGCSLESLQDLQGAITAQGLFEKFTAKALARGIGRQLMSGNGVGTIQGLIPSLVAGGAPQVAAAGSSANDGSSNSGSNSVGTPDLAALIAALDEAYLNDPSCRFLMNRKTWTTLLAQLDKVGSPVISVVGGAPALYGVPVLLSPSMANIGNGNIPIALGACSYWITKIVNGDGEMGVQLLTDAPGLPENGLVAFRSFVRAGGCLAWNGASSASAPFALLVNHS